MAIIERGAIRSEEAYVHGKMLDHSSWQKGALVLPRNITPSDHDMVFDALGQRALLCELSRPFSQWRELPRAQVMAYVSSILWTENLGILCHHSVPSDSQINTRSDIESFQVMLAPPHDPLLFTEVFVGNQRWQRFVFGWYNKPETIRDCCLKIARKNSSLPA